MSAEVFPDQNDTDFVNQFGDTSGFQNTDQASLGCEVNGTSEQPECIRKWAKEFEERIRIKDSREQEKLALFEEQGLKDLHSWATQYRESLSRSIKDSRTHEKELHTEQTAIAQASASLSGADASQAVLWDRVCQLCNFASVNLEDASATPPMTRQSGSKDSVKDLNRMRVLLLQLKQQPPIIQRKAVPAK